MRIFPKVLIPQKDAKYFEMQKLTCRGKYLLRNREKEFRVGVVVQGKLDLNEGIRDLQLNRGDSFFLPYSLDQANSAGPAKRSSRCRRILLHRLMTNYVMILTKCVIPLKKPPPCFRERGGMTFRVQRQITRGE